MSIDFTHTDDDGDRLDVYSLGLDDAVAFRATDHSDGENATVHLPEAAALVLADAIIERFRPPFKAGPATLLADAAPARIEYGLPYLVEQAKPGDILTVIPTEHGQALRIERAPIVVEATAKGPCSGCSLATEYLASTETMAETPKPADPVPGVYVDRDGDILVRTAEAKWHVVAWGSGRPAVGTIETPWHVSDEDAARLGDPTLLHAFGA